MNGTELQYLHSLYLNNEKVKNYRYKKKTVLIGYAQKKFACTELRIIE